MSSMRPEFQNYQKEMLQFYEELDELITSEAKSKKSASKDSDMAMVGLWRIITYNVYAVLTDFPDKRKFYAVAGCTRVTLECAADAEYIVTHPDEAEGYWKNQEQIKADLLARDDKWEAFIDGSINQHGSLKDRTLKRIQSTLGDDAMGSYSFLCFYSHPNTASMFWLLADSEGKTVKYVLQIMTQMLAKFLELLDSQTCFDIDSDAWKKRLDGIYGLLGSEKPEITV